MENHTLILSAPKLTIPESNIIEFIKDLISSNLLNIDYFGYEIDNPVDYEDDLMIAKRLSTSYITFQFEADEIDYENYKEEQTLQLIINLIQSNKIEEIMVDEKDIEIYILLNQ